MPLVALASAPSRANLLRITTIDHGACRYCIAMGTATRSHRLAVLLHGRSCEGSLHLTPILQFNLAQTGFKNISLIAMGSRRHLRRDERTQSSYYNVRARMFARFETYARARVRHPGAVYTSLAPYGRLRLGLPLSTLERGFLSLQYQITTICGKSFLSWRR